MNNDTLAFLGLSPEHIGHITGNQRTRLINFLLRWEQYETALACLEILIPLNPSLVSLYDAKARALLRLNRPEPALVVMQARHQIKAALNSRRLEAQIHLALGDTATALSIADDLVSEHPDAIMAWGLLGEVHLARNDLDAATAAYRRMGERGPHRRAYLLGMLALHQAQDDYVTASGYAARLQRSAEEGESLPAATLRRLHDYYWVSGETNRADDVQAALRALYDNELSVLEAAFIDDQKIVTRRPSWPVPAAETERITAIPEPLPIEETTPVSDQERQRLEQATKRFFGYESLLPGQAETMAAALRNQDVLTVLPTGGGKSLCYQLPALLDDGGTTLVISPLATLTQI